MKKAIVCGLLGWVGSASAHHGPVVEYQQHSRISLSGMVEEVEMVNPHAKLWLRVGDDQVCEVILPTPAKLIRIGWNKQLKTNQLVTLVGYRNREESGCQVWGAELVTGRAYRVTRK